MLLNKRCMDNDTMDYSFKEKYSSLEYENSNMNMDMSMNMGCDNKYPGVVCPPVYECPQIRICHREICHEVPHVVPVETKIINHHIYRHTYTPCYSCCEENEVCNVYDNKCCF